MRIYLDSCALNRLTDPPDQLRVQQEKAALLSIFLHIQRGSVSWIASSSLELEIRRNRDIHRRDAVISLLSFAKELWMPDRHAIARAGVLHGLGYGKFDALHLAIAEASKVDFLATTDDRFLRKIQRGVGTPTIQAENPIDLVRRVKP